MASYEQTLKLFSRWLKEKYDIENAEEVKEPHIRAYIVDLQQRGKVQQQWLPTSVSASVQSEAAIGA